MFLFYFFLLDQRQEKKEAQPVHAWCKGNMQHVQTVLFHFGLHNTTEAFPDILIKIISQFLLDFLFLGGRGHHKNGSVPFVELTLSWRNQNLSRQIQPDIMLHATFTKRVSTHLFCANYH